LQAPNNASLVRNVAGQKTVAVAVASNGYKTNAIGTAQQKHNGKER
jgi:hypothetical protein